MESPLLDFSKPLDVPLLDATVRVFYTSTNNDEVRAPGSEVGCFCGGQTGRRALGTFPGSFELFCVPASRAESPVLHTRAACCGGACHAGAAGAPGHVHASGRNLGDEYKHRCQVLCAAGAHTAVLIATATTRLDSEI